MFSHSFCVVILKRNHMVLHQWFVSYLMDKEILSQGKESIISGDEDNGSLCHVQNEYKLIQRETRL